MSEDIKWKNVKYSRGMHGEIGSITADAGNSHYCIPISEDNTEYKQIMALVEEGKLTIAPADEVSN